MLNRPNVILSKYLTREVVLTLSAVLGILLVAFLSQQIVRYLNYAAIGKIPASIMMELVSFEAPYLLAMLMPLALYLGIMLSFGRLHADNEMAIMQMGGYNRERLLKLTAFIALAAAGVVLFLMLWINPWISAKRQQMMEGDEATLHLIQTLVPGRFQASPDGRHVMYVESLSRDRDRAQNVFLADEKHDPKHPEQTSWMLVYADQGYQTSGADPSDQYFVTTNGYRYEGTPGQNNYTIVQYKKYTVRIGQGDPRELHQQNESLSTIDLLSDYGNPKRAAELQWRFSIAIATFLLAILAVPLSAVRPRQGRYLILLPAILVYIVYIQLLIIARHWVEQGTVSIAIGVWWVHALVLLGVLIVLHLSRSSR